MAHEVEDGGGEAVADGVGDFFVFAGGGGLFHGGGDGGEGGLPLVAVVEPVAGVGFEEGGEEVGGVFGGLEHGGVCEALEDDGRDGGEGDVVTRQEVEVGEGESTNGCVEGAGDEGARIARGIEIIDGREAQLDERAAGIDFNGFHV